MQNFRELKVWSKAHQLTLDVYRATSGFPREERYGLTSQSRRTCVSVPANIAEGCGRDSDRDFARHLRIAMGSANELDYLMELARDLEFRPQGLYSELVLKVNEVKRMLNAFIQTLSPKGAKS
jgi:four helix bundle protein